MRPRIKSITAWTVAAAIGAAGGAAAEVLDIRAETRAVVQQFRMGVLAGDDTNEESLPGSTTTVPVIARARLDRLNESMEVTASGESVAMFNDPRVSGAAPPDDVGIDIAAFSLDGETTYSAEGRVLETRMVRFGASEVNLAEGTPARARSLLLIAGGLVLVAQDPNADLTGLELDVQATLTQTRGAGTPQTLLNGSATVIGAADGAAQITGTGFVSPATLLNIQLDTFGIDLEQAEIGVARAVVFPALSFAYEYDFNVGETFELALDFRAAVRTAGANKGAAAIFGLPQVVLGETMRRVRGNESGRSVERALATAVDTTGSNATRPPTTISPVLRLCGTLGLESLPVVLAPLVWFAGRPRRRRSASESG